MPDIICTNCAEPWDATGIRDGDAQPEGNYDVAIEDLWPGLTDPTLRELAQAVLSADDTANQPHGKTDRQVEEAEEAYEAARDRFNSALYDTGLSKGCPACWGDPERVITDPAARAEVRVRALMEGAWDGDPAELF